MSVAPASQTPDALRSMAARVNADCYCLGLKRAARRVARRYDEALRPLGMNSGQFSMLASIAGLAPLSIGALAEHLAMDRTTVTAALKPVQRAGWVGVAPSNEDARARDVSLTASGRQLFERALPVWLDAQAQLADERLAGGGAQHQSLHALLATLA